jgi:hypothetical protein
MILSVDGGRSWIYSSGTSQGGHHQRFLALMVGTSESPALTPPGGPSLIFFSVGGGRSWIYSSGTFHGARCRCFFALMVDAPRSTALVPLRGPTIDVS